MSDDEAALPGIGSGSGAITTQAGGSRSEYPIPKPPRIWRMRLRNFNEQNPSQAPDRTAVIRKRRERRRGRIGGESKTNTRPQLDDPLIKIDEWDKIKKDFRTGNYDDDWTLLVKLALQYIWNHQRLGRHKYSKSLNEVETWLKEKSKETLDEEYIITEYKRDQEAENLILNLKFGRDLDKMQQDVYNALRSTLYKDNEEFRKNETFQVTFQGYNKLKWEWEQIYEGITDVYVQPINNIGQGRIIVARKKFDINSEYRFRKGRNPSIIWEIQQKFYAVAFKNENECEIIWQAIQKILKAREEEKKKLNAGRRYQRRARMAKLLQERGGTSRTGKKRPNRGPDGNRPVLGLTTLRF